MTDQRKTVLLVDDDIDVSSAYAEAISEAGYDVVSVHDGLKALEWLGRSEVPPAVVLLDLMMPVMDGRAFLSALDRGAGRRAPVVLMTAHRGDTDLDADAFVQKPASLETLLSTIARVSSAHEAASR